MENVSAIYKQIFQIVSNISPLDKLEKQHISSTLSWIKSGASIFRIQKPDIPSKHLVVYFVLWDRKAHKVLLVDHKQAGLWLPTGGHVEIDEDPKETVLRECKEELNYQAEFYFEHPLFLTSTTTVGLTAGHTDVSMWYVLKGDHQDSYEFDRGEFNDIRWFRLDEIPYHLSDPHMRRFIQKLQSVKRVII
jgi:8-oxo-dGTP pyrophosphatase MutT (NUDIX family)